MRWKTRSACAAALAAAVALTACATRHVPAPEVARSERAIRAAHLAGADRSDEAALHLRLAEEELRTAHTFLEEGESDDAAWLLGRAKADAELAQALAREAKAKKAVEEKR